MRRLFQLALALWLVAAQAQSPPPATALDAWLSNVKTLRAEFTQVITERKRSQPAPRFGRKKPHRRAEQTNWKKDFSARMNGSCQ